MKTIIKAIKSLWATLKDPHLLSSKPHTTSDHHDLMNTQLEEDTGWTCSQCQIRHTSDMKIGHREWDFLSEEILLCVQCCDDLNHQGASEAEKDCPHA